MGQGFADDRSHILRTEAIELNSAAVETALFTESVG